VVGKHELGFKKALRQVALTFSVHVDDKRFDVGKDVYQKSLVRLEDIPSLLKHAKDTPSIPSREGREGGADKVEGRDWLVSLTDVFCVVTGFVSLFWPDDVQLWDMFVYD